MRAREGEKERERERERGVYISSGQYTIAYIAMLLNLKGQRFYDFEKWDSGQFEILCAHLRLNIL